MLGVHGKPCSYQTYTYSTASYVSYHGENKTFTRQILISRLITYTPFYRLCSRSLSYLVSSPKPSCRWINVWTSYFRFSIVSLLSKYSGKHVFVIEKYTADKLSVVVNKKLISAAFLVTQEQDSYPGSSVTFPSPHLVDKQGKYVFGVFMCAYMREVLYVQSTISFHSTSVITMTSQVDKGVLIFFFFLESDTN